MPKVTIILFYVLNSESGVPVLYIFNKSNLLNLFCSPQKRIRKEQKVEADSSSDFSSMKF
jgi:hypothetical protein